jgi:Tfp pilus assembly protein PilN
MAQINLAPASQYAAASRQRRNILYGLAVAVVAVVIIAGIVLSVMVSSAKKSHQAAQQELQSVETKIAAASEEIRRIQLFENRLTNLAQLLDNHKVWSPHLQELERLLPPETILTNVKGSHDSRTVELTGSTPNIDVVAVALANLKNKVPNHATLFSNGTIGSVTREEQRGQAGEVVGARYVFKMNLAF